MSESFLEEIKPATGVQFAKFNNSSGFRPEEELQKRCFLSV